jgi:hypothetical protein
MNRREFIAAFAGATVWPLLAHAQHTSSGKLQRLGILQPGSSPSGAKGKPAAKVKQLPSFF